VLTAAHQREVAWFDLEAVVPPKGFADGVEDRRGYLDDALAVRTHQMVVVTLLDEVVHSRPVPEPDGIDDAQPLELVEKPVHRGFGDVGVTLLHG